MVQTINPNFFDPHTHDYLPANGAITHSIYLEACCQRRPFHVPVAQNKGRERGRPRASEGKMVRERKRSRYINTEALHIVQEHHLFTQEHRETHTHAYTHVPSVVCKTARGHQFPPSTSKLIVISLCSYSTCALKMGEYVG